MTHTEERGPVESIIAKLVEFTHQISGLRAEDIDPEANLFYLGLDSLTLVDLQNKAQNYYNIQLDVKDLFENYNTLRLIGEYIQSQTSVAKPSPEPVLKPAPVITETKDSLASSASIHLPDAPSPQASDVIIEVISHQLQLMQRQLEVLSSGGISPQAEELKTSATQVQPPKAIPQPPLPSPVKRYDSFNPVRGMIFADEPLTVQQRKFIGEFCERYNRRTAQSKVQAQAHRRRTADWINNLGFRKVIKELIYPLISARSQGAHFTDIDGNDYIDIAMGYGVHFFGHQPSFVMEALKRQLNEGFELGPQSDLVGENARLLCELTGVERAAYTNTGSEAVMAAVRLARAVTEKNELVMFAGSFHGTFDGVLAYAEGEHTLPFSPGTPANMISDVKVLTYGSEDSLQYIHDNHQRVAAVLCEPVQSRRPGMQPREFLQSLRSITKQRGVALIFDEIITGFRIHPGGAQHYFGVSADLVTYGKIVGGGMPIGVVSGSAAYMDALDGGWWDYSEGSMPDKMTTVYGGTFCKHPLAMAAANAVLKHLQTQGPALQERVNRLTARLAEQLNRFFEAEAVPVRIKYFGSLFRFESFGKYDLSRFPLEMDLLFFLMMLKGIYTWERRISFLSTEHSESDIDKIVSVVQESIYELRQGGFEFRDEQVSHPKKSKEIDLKGPAEDLLRGRSDRRAPILTGTMSSSQQRLFVLSQLPDGEKGYHMTGAVKLTGNLNRDKLEAILHQLVQRHDSLRTGFCIRNDRFIREVYDDVDFQLETAEIPPEQVEDYLRKFVRPFDLSQPPLFRAGLAKVVGESAPNVKKNDNNPAEHYFILDTHHTMSDGLSLNILMQEFTELYNDRALPPLKATYTDYVIDEQIFLNSSRFKRVEDYWLNLYKEPIPDFDLPYDYPRPPYQTFTGACQRSVIDTDFTQNIERFARESKTTPFNVLFAACNVLLNRLSGQSDLIVGVPVSGRSSEKFSNIVGMFVKSLPLRTDIKPDDTISSYLSRIKPVVTSSVAHQEYPLEMLVDNLKLPHDPGRNALFSVMFVYERADDRLPELPELEIEDVDLYIETSLFDLIVECIQQRGRIKLNLYYNTRLFRSNTLKLWQDYYLQILKQAIQRPELPIAKIALENESGVRQSILVGPAREFDPQLSTITSIFEREFADNPDRPVVIFGDKVVTAANLQELSDRMALNLIEHQRVKPGDCVGLHIPPSEHLLTMMLGVMKAGAAFLPIDTKNPRERIDYFINNAGVKLIVSDSEQLLNSGLKCSVIPIDSALRPRTTSPGDGVSSPSSKQKQTRVQTPAVKPEDIAYVIYTSGTTGVPKGVPITHLPMANYMLWFKDYFGITTEDRTLLLTSFAFDHAFPQLICMTAGGGSVYITSELERLDPERVIDIVVDRKLTIINLTPPYLNLILSSRNAKKLRQAKHLRILLQGCEAIRPQNTRQFLELCPHIQVCDHYGPTETTIGCLSYSFGVSDLDKFLDQPLIGTPLDNMEVLVIAPLDKSGSLDIKIQPVGVPGEIVIAGLGLSAGYLNNPEKTDAAFICSASGQRLYRTGDKGRITPEGQVEYMGRISSQIKWNSYRIDPREIEAALEKHEAIQYAAVVVRDDNPLAPDLVAFYTLVHQGLPGIVAAKKQTALSDSSLSAYLKPRIPSYAMPTKFVLIDEMPLTVNGKLDRRALISRPISAPQLDESPIIHELADRDEVLEQIIQIWREILGIQTLKISDDFFAIGGNSLKAILLVMKLREQLGWNIELEDLFRYPTVIQLRAHSGGFSIPTLPPIKPPAEQDYYEISHAQKRLWILADGSDSASRAYNVHGIFECNQRLDEKALKLALEQESLRHESLRTTFHFIDGQPRQKIHAAPLYELFVTHCSKTSDLLTTAQEAYNIEIEHTFDLTRGPLLRIQYVDSNEDNINSYLIFNAHHIIIDGWSSYILMDELINLYQNAIGKEEKDTKTALPALPIQYKDYAAWHNALIEGDILSPHRDYWRQKLAGPLPAVELFGKTYPQQPSFSGRWHIFQLPGELSQKLQESAKIHRTSLFSVLTAAMKTMLFAHSSQGDIVISSPVSGRVAAELRDQVGFYLNMVVIRDLFTGREKIVEVIDKVSATVREALEHEIYPIDAILEEELEPPLGFDRIPIMDVIVNLIDFTHRKAVAHQGLQCRLYKEDSRTSRALLNCMFLVEDNPDKDTPQSIQVMFEYNDEVFSAVQITQLEVLLRKILSVVVSSGDRTLDDIRREFNPREGIEDQQQFLKATMNVNEEF